MDYEIYRQRLEVLKQEYKYQKRKLAKDYATKHNTVKLGDVVTDNLGSVKVDKIEYTTRDEPECYYWGVILTEFGKDTEHVKRRWIAQHNILKNL